jgi:hypothetical protein
MDPQYLKTLRDAPGPWDFFREGISGTQGDIETTVSNSRSTSTTPVPLSVSQPGGPPTAPVVTTDHLKGLSDSECRNPSTNRYLYDYRKCSKCPSNTCFSNILQFSQEQEKKESSIRLCLQHEGIQGQAGVFITVQTPKP